VRTYKKDDNLIFIENPTKQTNHLIIIQIRETTLLWLECQKNLIL